jgi:hypothetical protein
VSIGLNPRPELSSLWTHDANLLLQAALAQPDIAIPAWHEICRGQDISQFPHWKTRLLGQVGKNLSGHSEELPGGSVIRGVRRATWVKNSLRMRLLQEFLTTIHNSERFVFLKGVALCHHTNDLATRPMGDSDVFVPNDLVAEVLNQMDELGFCVRNLGTVRDVLLRHRHRTVGCNLFHPEFGEIDVHWGIATNLALSNLPLRAQEVAVIRNSQFNEPSLMSYYNREMLIVHTLQHMTRQDPRSIGATIQGLCDLAVLSDEVSVNRLNELLEQFDLDEQYRQAVKFLSQLKCMREPRQDLIAHTSRESLNAFSPEVGTWPQRVSFLQRLEPSPERLCFRSYKLFALWQALGSSRRIESLLIRLFGPFTKVSDELCSATSFDFESGCGCASHLGAGWSPWIPTSKGVWSDRSDARLLLRAPNDKKATETLEIELMLGQEWLHSPYACTHIFANGYRIGSLTRSERDHTTSTTRRYRLPRKITRGEVIELSFRPTGFVPRRVLGLGIETHRLGIALRGVRVVKT